MTKCLVSQSVREAEPRMALFWMLPFFLAVTLTLGVEAKKKIFLVDVASKETGGDYGWFDGFKFLKPAEPLYEQTSNFQGAYICREMF